MRRELWLDALRGATMILVVFGHVARGLFAAGQIDDPIYPRLDLVLYSLHGPLLFVLAGYTFRLAQGRRAYLPDWRGRMWKALHPYFIWTFITATAVFALAAVVNRPLSIGDYLAALAWSPILPYSIFWFLYVLAATQPALALATERWGLSTGKVLALGVGGLGLHQILQATTGPVDAFQISNNLRYFFFLALGAWLADRKAPPSGRLALAAIVPVGLAWAAILGLGWGIDGPFGLATSALVTTAAMIAARALESRAPRALYAALAFLGVWSLEIYVMHVLFNGAVRIGLNMAGVEALLPHMIVGTIMGTLAPVAMGLLLRHMGLAPILGLTAAPVRRAETKPAVAG